jgi:hypothetical protein
MKYWIFLTLALFGGTAAQAQSIEAEGQNRGDEINAECQTTSHNLNTIMQNADRGARYKFDPSTVIGRMNIEAYNFALQHKEDAARQQFLSQAVDNCIRDSKKAVAAKIK